MRGASALAAIHRGGIEPLLATRAEFAHQLRCENHTLKRSLTDPRLFSGTGNAYSDEILHHARISPLLTTARFSDEQVARLHDSTVTVLNEWIQRLRAEVVTGFPETVTAFRPAMKLHGRYGQPSLTAEPRFNAFDTPRTRPTIAPDAKQTAACSRIVRSRGCSRGTRLSRSTSWRGDVEQGYACGAELPGPRLDRNVKKGLVAARSRCAADAGKMGADFPLPGVGALSAHGAKVFVQPLQRSRHEVGAREEVATLEHNPLFGAGR